MSGLANRAEFPKLLEPTLKKAFFYEYNLGGEQYSRFWDVQDSYKSKEEIVETVIPSEVPTVNEGGMYARGEMLMGRSKTFVHVTRKLEIVMTEEMSEDNLYPAALKTQKALAITMKRTIEKVAATTFSNGLTSEFTPDGVNVFAPNHPVLYPTGNNPSTWGNVLANQAFSSTTVKGLKTLMRKQRDERGDTAPHEMDQLMVPPDLQEEAEEMYSAPGKYDSPNLTSNQTAKGLTVIPVNHFQDASHPWAATAIFGRDSRMAMNIFFFRVRPEYKLVYEESTGNIIQRVRTRFSLGVVNPRGLVSAYS